jgi:hypothetical protein
MRTWSSRVRSCVTRSTGALERLESGLELLDRGQVEMVRRFVEHEAVRAVAMSSASTARVRSPGDSESVRPVDL